MATSSTPSVAGLAASEGGAASAAVSFTVARQSGHVVIEDPRRMV